MHQTEQASLHQDKMSDFSFESQDRQLGVKHLSIQEAPHLNVFLLELSEEVNEGLVLNVEDFLDESSILGNQLEVL